MQGCLWNSQFTYLEYTVTEIPFKSISIRILKNPSLSIVPLGQPKIFDWKWKQGKRNEKR